MASCTKLRPLSGRSCTCFSSITVPSTDDWRFEQRGRALDQDGLADQPDFQLQVDLRALIDLQFHARALDLAKPREFRRSACSGRAAAT